MGERVITEQSLFDQVHRLQDQHPPLRIDEVDRTVHDPQAVATRFAGTLDYLARVELEVERNVLELLTVLPDASEIDRFFFEDVWGPQEIAHGHILDQLKADVGLPASDPVTDVVFSMKVTGALAHFGQIQDVSRMMYYLTGSSTERQAVLAYSTFIDELERMGEHAIAQSVIHPIKRQEPGHFAFYSQSAKRMVQQGELAPWQMFLVRQLRSKSFNLVGTHGDPVYKAQMGEVIVTLGFDEELERFAEDLGRLERKVLWAEDQGMRFPPYFLRALTECVDLYRERGSWVAPTAANPARVAG